MINEQVLHGHWNEIKGMLRSKWGQLTNDDVLNFDGNVDRLVGLIQRKTGEGREAIERFLDETTARASAFEERRRKCPPIRTGMGRAKRIQDGNETQFAESLREGYDNLRDGYQDAGRRAGAKPAVRSGGGLLRRRRTDGIAGSPASSSAVISKRSAW